MGLIVQPRTGKHQPGEALDRFAAVVTAQWVGLKVAGLGLALVTVALIGVPVVTAVERLSLDLEAILHTAALPDARR